MIFERHDGQTDEQARAGRAVYYARYPHIWREIDRIRREHDPWSGGVLYVDRHEARVLESCAEFSTERLGPLPERIDQPAMIGRFCAAHVWLKPDMGATIVRKEPA